LSITALCRFQDLSTKANIAVIEAMSETILSTCKLLYTKPLLSGLKNRVVLKCPSPLVFTVKYQLLDSISPTKDLGMKHHDTVFHQLLKFLLRQRFQAMVDRHQGDRKTRTLTCWD
jgi:hypothetical protein